MVRCFGLMTGLLAGLLLVTPAEAGPKGNKDHDKGKENGHSEGLKCPPGLAKKTPPCVPPGLARNNDPQPEIPPYDAHFDTYIIGQRLPDAYVLLFDPRLYPLWQSAVFVRFGDYLYLIDRLTGAVLLNSGPVTDWTWGWSDIDFAQCPPGLAKKNPPCVPPGQAKKGAGVDPYKVGDLLPPTYSIILTPSPPTVADGSVYVRLGDSLYRVAPATGQVQEQIGEVGRLIK